MAVQRWCWIVYVAVCSCSSQRYLSIAVHQAEKDFKDHIGFVLYDPGQQKLMYNHQGDRYFTPASNTKIFTLFASLQLLGDSVPALRYVQRNDSLIFWGTGDPGFLYENTSRENRVYDFLKTTSLNLFFSSSNFQTEYFGPGWSWDDYNESYQVEKTSFPMYGNRVSVKRTGTAFMSRPDVFSYTISDSVKNERSTITRGIDSNVLTFRPGKTDRPTEWNIPFHYSDELLVKLLTDTIKKEVQLTRTTLPPDAKTLYSAVPDSLYTVMMQASDNFIAEQLLLLCANVVSDTLKPEIAIRYVKKKFLFDLPDEPVWLDGSGLSRYNLFTPRSLVRLWEKIYALVPRERLFQLLAVGGKSGTLRSYYKGDQTPYIFGKTGFLSNNYTLSGYLITKRGRTLIFSWMNNNFMGSAGEVRARMEIILKRIYEKN